METTAPPPAERPQFSDLNIGTEMQFNLDEERELLQELTFNREVDADFVEQLNRELAIATAPMPTDHVAEARESRTAIYQARDTVFALLGLDEPQHQLNGTFQRAKTLSTVKSPSPAALLISARLIKSMHVPVTETLQKANKLLYMVPDINGLDGLESTFRQHDLSIWDNPILAIQPAEQAESRLSQLHSSLTRLSLPITVADVVLAEPSVLRHAEERTSLLADLAMAHANLRQYIRSPHHRRDGRRVPLRERLVRDLCAALGSYTPEVHMIGILEYGGMGLPQARQAKKQISGVKSSREALLNRLSNDGIKRIGVATVGAYLAQKPLTDEERQEFPALAKLSSEPQAESKKPAQSPEKVVQVSPLDDEDISWLREVMRQRQIGSRQKVELLERLNDALAHGSKPLSPQISSRNRDKNSEIINHRHEFFRLLGWTNPTHPINASFMACLKQGDPPRPDEAVAILRVLAEPGKAQLVRIVGRDNCKILRKGNAQAVQQRVNIARTRAKNWQTTVGWVLGAQDEWLLNPLPPIAEA